MNVLKQKYFNVPSYCYIVLSRLYFKNNKLLLVNCFVLNSLIVDVQGYSQEINLLHL